MNKLFFSGNISLIEHKLYELTGKQCRLMLASSYYIISYPGI